MKLPQTREEFLLWKLEHSASKELFWGKYNLECGQLHKLEKWIQDTYTKFPDLVKHIKDHDGEVCIIFVGVRVVTLRLCDIWEMNILSYAARFHCSKYGEAL